MARKALLTVAQCNQVRTLYEAGARAIELAKKFGVSESSLYKVLDGTYKARPSEMRRMAIPAVKVEKPMGVTPSLFESTAREMNQEPHPALSKMLVEKAQQIDDCELDDLTIAAAELIVARAKLNRVLAHVH